MPGSATALRVLLSALCISWLCSGVLSPVAAQTRGGPSVGAPGTTSGLDPRGSNRRAAIRFVTTSDYPPFNYFDEDGSLTGFNVKLAEVVCQELGATCDIQVKPWDDVLATVKRGEADAAIASHTASARVLQDFAVSDRYYHTPGRFVGLKKSAIQDVSPSGLDGRKLAVVKGSAHEGYLRAFFTLSNIQVFENADLARDAIRSASADLYFDDGIGLVFWLNGEASKICCEFKGGPFMEPRFFGDGIGIVLNKDDTQLKTLVNGALKRMRDSGRHEELMLRFFPLRAY